MILPSRPMRVDPAFVRHAWLRVFGFLAPGLAILLVVGLWQGRAAYELALDQMAWRVGEPVPVSDVDTHVTVVAALSRHVRITASVIWEDQAWVVRDDYWTLFTDSVGDGPLEARRDASTQRVAFSWSMEAAAWRWAWILFFALVLGALGAFLCCVAWRALRALRDARAVALGSAEEIELEVIGVKRQHEGASNESVEVTYRIPPIASQAPVGYRTAAASAASVHTAYFDSSDPGPILLDGETRLLALRAASGREVTVLCSGFWPFLLDPAEQERAAARLEHRA